MNEICLALDDTSDLNGGLRFISFEIEKDGVYPKFDELKHYYEQNI